MDLRRVMYSIVILIICSTSLTALAATPQYHAPVVLETAPIEYPSIARDNDMEGTSLLAVSISAEGRIIDVAIKSSSGYLILDNAALESLKKWKFSPAHDENGKAIDCIVVFPFDFKLAAPSQEEQLSHQV